MTDLIDHENTPRNEPTPVIRRCVACRLMQDRRVMIRIVFTWRNKEIRIIMPDEGIHVFSGRSSYLCANVDCIEKAIKAKRLQRTLKTSVADDIVNCLLQLSEGIKTRATNKG